MQLTWGSLVLVLTAAAIAWFWQDSLRVRELANAAAMQACTRLGLQFLDGTVAFTRLRLTYRHGHLKLHRWYVFDYTAYSIDRLQGFIVLHGELVESVGFAPDLQHREAIVMPASDATPLPPSPISTAGQNDDARDKVQDLEKWRQMRGSRH